jgi:hypothetical protein
MDGNFPTATERASALFSDFSDAPGTGTGHAGPDDAPAVHFTFDSSETSVPSADRAE